MNPKMLHYTKDHEWIGEEANDRFVIGITDFAQDQLGDITFIELPKVGAQLKQHGAAATVESVKAASDVYSPVAGKVVEVNDTLESQPDLVNKDPYGDGWFFKLEGVDESELRDMMDIEAYKKYCEEVTH